MTRRSSTRLFLALIIAVAGGCSASSGSLGDRAPLAEAQGGSPPSNDRTPLPAEASASVAPDRSPLPADPTPADPAPPGPDRNDVPSRVVVPALDIDLAVVSGDLEVAGNPPDYPLCDVAQYLTTYRHPGRPGTTTWVYAHARPGMFLPLLAASERDDGASLVGLEVDVYTAGAQRYTYRITRVLRHAVDRTAAARVPADGRRLVLQTSEGPRGTIPKLQVVAEFMSVEKVAVAEARPEASPRVCAG